MNYVDEQPPLQGHPAPPPKKSSNAWVIVIVGVVVAVPVLGILASLGIYGVARYMRNAKGAEGRANVVAMGHNLEACGIPLPPSSTAVPITAPRGAKYMSTSAEWNQPAFTCGAGFSMATPQYFSYQWVRDSPTRGRAIATADMDGDGAAEQRYEVVVECAGTSCVAQRPTEVR